MHKKVRVGLTMRIDNDPNYGEPRDAISQDWIKYVLDLGLSPVLIPNSDSLTTSDLEELNFTALIMTSGGNTNIDANGVINDKCDSRDITESLVFNYALKRKFPILGICRGMQFIFKFYGGQLKNINDKTHVDKLHDIKLKNGSKRSVCSYHEFVCSNRLIPNDLEVWATASDGTIEAIEHKSHRVMGMQWHPERKYPSASEDINIIKAFFNIND